MRQQRFGPDSNRYFVRPCSFFLSFCLLSKSVVLFISVFLSCVRGGRGGGGTKHWSLQRRCLFVPHTKDSGFQSLGSGSRSAGRR